MRKSPSDAKVSVRIEKKGLSLMIASANRGNLWAVVVEMNLTLLDQITRKRNGVPVDRVIFLQHWAAFI